MTTRRILAIATSNASPLRGGKKTGLWLSELTHFLGVVVDAGYDYDIASPLGGPIPLDENSDTPRQHADPVNKRFMADAAFRAKLAGSLACRDLDAARYDAIYLAGGHGTMFDFRQSADLQRLLTAFDSDDKFLTGVCHGVAGFIDTVDRHGKLLVRGKRTTGFSNFEDTLGGTKKLMPFLLEDELKKQGSDYRKNFLPFTERVEHDGRLITGQNPQSARKVGEVLVSALAQPR